MADETTTTYANLLVDMKGPLVENFPKYSVLLSELKRDTNRKNFHGKQVRVPLILNTKQGTGPLSETGTLNSPQALNTSAANITMARVAHPISFSPDVMYTSEADVTSFGAAAKLEMQEAEVALPRTVNEMVNGNGDGVLAAATASTNTTAITVLNTTQTAYQLYPGRIVDIGPVTPGANIANGSARTILSTAVSGANLVVTLDAGGGSVNVTSGTHGVIIQGANTASGSSALQGILQARATSGTFETINKATTPGWQGIDGRAGDTSSADLSVGILDGCERRVKASGTSPDFYIGDPAVIDKFGQTLLTQARWAGDKGTLDTGWSGIQYRNKLVIPEFDHLGSSVTGINRNSFSFYGYNEGPDWDKMDGSMFRRFNRTLIVEAWLVDYVQLGVHRCNSAVFANNLNAAS